MAEIVDTLSEKASASRPPHKKGKITSGDGRGGFLTKKAPLILSDKWFYMKPDKVRDYLRDVERTMFFDIASRKLWSSIAPADIDLTLHEGTDTYRAKERFSRHVLNGIWSKQLYKAVRSVLAVGYYLVSYVPISRVRDIARDGGGNTAEAPFTKQELAGLGLDERNEHDIGLIPVVVSPWHFMLWWRYDQFGRRHYVAKPYKLPEVVLRTSPDQQEPHQSRGPSSVHWTEADFIDAEVFVYDEPSDRGDIASRTRNCMESIVHIQQILHDYMLTTNSRTNVPLIVEAESPDLANNRFGTSRVVTMLGEREAMMNRAQSGMAMIPPPPGSALASPEDLIGMDLTAHAARTTGQARTSTSLIAESVAHASATADNMPLRIFSQDSGVVVTADPQQPWQRARLDLPLGHVAKFEVPEPPKSMPNVLHVLVAFVCATLQIPQEVVLGSSGKDVRVTATTMAEENLRSVICWWRSQLASDMEVMYWHIYGGMHVKQLLRVLEICNIQPEQSRIEETMKDITVEFSFRSMRMDVNMAMTLYDKRYLKWDAVRDTLVSELGVPQEYIEEIGPNERQDRVAMAEFALKASGAKKTSSSSSSSSSSSKEGEGLGNMNLGDLSAVAFSSGKPPAKERDQSPVIK